MGLAKVGGDRRIDDAIKSVDKYLVNLITESLLVDRFGRFDGPDVARHDDDAAGGDLNAVQDIAVRIGRWLASDRSCVGHQLWLTKFSSYIDCDCLCVSLEPTDSRLAD